MTRLRWEAGADPPEETKQDCNTLGGPGPATQGNSKSRAQGSVIPQHDTMSGGMCRTGVQQGRVVYPGCGEGRLPGLPSGSQRCGKAISHPGYHLSACRTCTSFLPVTPRPSLPARPLAIRQVPCISSGLVLQVGRCTAGYTLPGNTCGYTLLGNTCWVHTARVTSLDG